MSAVGVDRVLRLFGPLFDPAEFLSPHGLRSLFGGNSNWRGPIWFPLNYLAISAIERYHRFFGTDLTVEYPTGSGHRLTLDEVAADLRERLATIFTVGHRRRPCFGWIGRFPSDPAWKDNLMFHEYFHADNAAGLGASHQTGWTGIVADVIRRRHGAVEAVDDVLLRLGEPS